MNYDKLEQLCISGALLSSDGVIPEVTEREHLSCPVGPLTPAQPCKPCPQQLLPVPALWSGVKWGPQKDTPAS